MNAPTSPLPEESAVTPASGPTQRVADRLKKVDAVIRSRLDSDVVLVRQVAEYIIHSGGKRVRPALLLMMAQAMERHLDGKAPLPAGLGAHNTEVLAAVVEFIHTATLLHDDVVDESNLRRGRPTAHVLFGNAASVLVGDFLYSRAFQMMVEVGSSDVMAVMAEATNVIAEGEVLQLMNVHDPDVTEARYLQVIRFKTAKLFEAAARIPAVLARAPADIAEGCAAYGRHLGTAFQLIDDALDYDGAESEIGKRLGDDLREGKPTLPLIRVLSHGTTQEKTLIQQAIREPDSADFDAVVAAIHRTDAMRYTLECAAEECRLARQAIAGLKASEDKTALEDLLDFVIQRRA